MSLFLTIRYDGHFLSEIRFKNKKKNKRKFAVAQEMDIHARFNKLLLMNK